MLAALKSFFRFLKSEGLVHHDPAEALEYARQPKCLPRNVLTQQEARQILDRWILPPRWERDRAILEVLYATGIGKKNSVVWSRATSTSTVVFAHHPRQRGTRSGCASWNRGGRCLKSYLNQARPELMGDSFADRLLSRTGAIPLGPHTLGSVVKKHAEAARIKKLVTPHVASYLCHPPHPKSRQFAARPGPLGASLLGHHGALWAAEERGRNVAV